MPAAPRPASMIAAASSAEAARQQMIQQQVRAWEVLDERVLQVFERVPREHFVPHGFEALAFADAAIPLAHGERMLAPKVVGRILQALDVRSSDRVLEIGTGSGFLTACLALQAATVLSLEWHADLAANAERRLGEFGAINATVRHGDVYAADVLAVDARFDVVVLTGSLPVADDRFKKRLAPGGRLFAVMGPPPVMQATLVRRVEDAGFASEMLFETDLAPLHGARRPPAFEF
jgi:protein-L-isoaspartate(D-aspartate) O-methyltransferase